jgi:hypothetical protein
MDVMSEVKLRIDGDSSGAAKAIDDVKKKQKELDDVIQKATIASGIAFAGLSASIVGVLDAFSENEQAALRQEAVLKSTGFAAGLTASELDRMARALQDSTRFSDDNIASAQNALLTFTKIGRETFPEATKAVLDFAQANGVDATGAAQLLGRALNDPIRGVTQLSRAGIQFTEQQKNQIEALVKTGQTAQAQAIILQQLSVATGGSAEAAAKGTGAFAQLKNTFSNVAAAVGQEIAPAFILVAQKLNDFLKIIRDNPAITAFIGRALVAATAIAGIATAVGSVLILLPSLTAGLGVVAAAFGVTKLAAAAALGAMTLGLGLVIAFLPEIIGFAKTIGDTFRDTFSNLGDLAGTFGQLLKSAFTLDFEGVKENFAKLKQQISDGITQAAEDFKETKIALGFGADTTQADAARVQQLELDRQAAEARVELARLEKEQKALVAQGASEELIQQKQAEMAMLREIEDAKTVEDQERHLIQLETLRAQQAERRQVLLEEELIKREQDLALRAEFEALDDEDRARISAKELEQFRATVLTRKQAEEAVAKERLQARIKARNDYLKDEAKFGTDIANLRKFLFSEEVKQTQELFSTLSQLQSSGSRKMFEIGKAAGLANALVSVATGTAKALELPFPANIIAAATVAAKGAIEVSKINAVQFQGAQTGGVVGGLGVVPGFGQGDRVPMLLEPGEIVVPKTLAPSFSEQFAINSQNDVPRGGTFNFTIQGDIIGDDNFVNNSLIPKIREAVQFSNADLGVA